MGPARLHPTQKGRVRYGLLWFHQQFQASQVLLMTLLHGPVLLWLSSILRLSCHLAGNMERLWIRRYAFPSINHPEFAHVPYAA